LNAPVSLTWWDRGFESVFLQRRVCEPLVPAKNHGGRQQFGYISTRDKKSAEPKPDAEAATEFHDPGDGAGFGGGPSSEELGGFRTPQAIVDGAAVPHPNAAGGLARNGLTGG
jgi:hypothetical protein